MKQWQTLWAGVVLAFFVATPVHAQILIGQTAGFGGRWRRG